MERRRKNLDCLQSQSRFNQIKWLIMPKPVWISCSGRWPVFSRRSSRSVGWFIFSSYVSPIFLPPWFLYRWKVRLDVWVLRKKGFVTGRWSHLWVLFCGRLRLNFHPTQSRVALSEFTPFFLLMTSIIYYLLVGRLWCLFRRILSSAHRLSLPRLLVTFAALAAAFLANPAPNFLSLPLVTP